MGGTFGGARAGAAAVAVAVALAGAGGWSAGAQTSAGAAVPGAICMRLNLTPEQMMDRSLSVPIRAAPSASAPAIGEASAVVIARDPPVPRAGHLEVMMPNGRVGWMDARLLRPWDSGPDGRASRPCRPTMTSDGLVGFSTR